MTAPSAGSPTHGVLALTADPALGDELARLAAAAGAPLQVRAGPPELVDWLSARLLVVGGDLARAVGQCGHPRRPGVLLVTDDPDDGDVWQHAVGLGAEQVAVLPDSRDWLVERLAAAVEPAGSAYVVAVVGGCGGAGASVLAAALAVTAAGVGRQVLLADLDPLGGGADLILGVDDVPGLRWPDLAAARGRLPAGSVRDALPRLDGLAVLAWGRGDPIDLPARAVDAVLSAAARAHDLVVIDLPRIGDASAAAALRRADELLVVVPARLRAAASAAQLLARLEPSGPPVRAVVRRGGTDALAARAVSDALGAPLAMQMRDEPQLDRALGRGEPPGLRPRGPLRRAAEQWLARLDNGHAAA